MKVLHYYPESDEMISRYVSTLCDTMGLECTNVKTAITADAIRLLQHGEFDILHLHGCWRDGSYRVVRQAFKNGARLVLSPYGQLEPWVMAEHRLREKLPKMILYQERLVRQAYTVVIQGKMEQECIRKLGWNSRTVIIRNCLITSSTTPEEMASRLFHTYRKVLDSNTLELMSDENLTLLTTLLKVSITGDRRWLADSPPYPTSLTLEGWRQLLCFAHQEHLTDMIRHGLNILQIEPPDMDIAEQSFFLPDGFVQPVSIVSAIGNKYTSENERLVATFRYMRKLITQRQLAVMHLVELDRELRQQYCEEAELAETLEAHRLLPTARRLMQLSSEWTGLTEGFMPVSPLNDRTTRKIRKQIENHLKI